MSYCRWSSDFFQCDVYVYEHVSGGWTTHVAWRRLKHRPPESITSMSDVTGSDYWARHQAYEAWRDTLPCDEFPVNYHDPSAPGGHRPGIIRLPKDSEYLELTEIGPEAGETYSDSTPGACADRLEALRAKGFNVPQRAIDALRAESLEAQAAAIIQDANLFLTALQQMRLCTAGGANHCQKCRDCLDVGLALMPRLIQAITDGLAQPAESETR